MGKITIKRAFGTPAKQKFAIEIIAGLSLDIKIHFKLRVSRKWQWNHPWILFQNLFHCTTSHDVVRMKQSVCHSSDTLLTAQT